MLWLHIIIVLLSNKIIAWASQIICILFFPKSYIILVYTLHDSLHEDPTLSIHSLDRTGSAAVLLYYLDNAPSASAPHTVILAKINLRCTFQCRRAFICQQIYLRSAGHTQGQQGSQGEGEQN